MAKREVIPQKNAVGHLYSPADSKRYNVPRSFGASPKANPFNSGKGVDLTAGVYHPRLKGANIKGQAPGRGLESADSRKNRGAGADLAKVYPISLEHATRGRGGR